MTKDEILEAIKQMNVIELSDMVKALEDEFGDSISEEDAEGLATLRDIVECISGRLGENAVASQS